MTTESSSNHVEIRAENLEPPSWMDSLRHFVLRVLEELSVQNWEVSVLLVDDTTMRELNRKFRNIDRPTDVLSFAAFDASTLDHAAPDISVGPIAAGDIVIDLPQVERQAQEWKIPVEEELRRMTIHGVLHLAGHDHQSNSFEEEPMLRLQESILQSVQERIY
jgi:probable rRNA maturation factor